MPIFLETHLASGLMTLEFTWSCFSQSPITQPKSHITKLTFCDTLKLTSPHLSSFTFKMGVILSNIVRVLYAVSIKY